MQRHITLINIITAMGMKLDHFIFLQKKQPKK